MYSSCSRRCVIVASYFIRLLSTLPIVPLFLLSVVHRIPLLLLPSYFFPAHHYCRPFLSSTFHFSPAPVCCPELPLLLASHDRTSPAAWLPAPPLRQVVPPCRIVLPPSLFLLATTPTTRCHLRHRLTTVISDNCPFLSPSPGDALHITAPAVDLLPLLCCVVAWPIRGIC